MSNYADIGKITKNGKTYWKVSKNAELKNKSGYDTDIYMTDTEYKKNEKELKKLVRETNAGKQTDLFSFSKSHNLSAETYHFTDKKVDNVRFNREKEERSVYDLWKHAPLKSQKWLHLE